MLNRFYKIIEGTLKLGENVFCKVAVFGSVVLQIEWIQIDQVRIAQASAVHHHLEE